MAIKAKEIADDRSHYYITKVRIFNKDDYRLNCKNESAFRSSSDYLTINENND